MLDEFESRVIKNFEYYQLPMIQLRSELSKEAVCQVFEDTNSSNKPLNLLVTLAAICTVLKERVATDRVRSQLMQWFWCGALCESFSGSPTSRAARDLIETLDWIDGSSEPMTIQQAVFDESWLLTLRNRRGAIFKAVAALLRNEGVLDFITGEKITDTKYFEEKVDVHHIFPRAWCDRSEIESKRYNCFVNKTPLSMRTNRVLGSMAPSKYLQKIGWIGSCALT